MTNGWQTASIGDVAKPIERAEVPMAGTTYRQIGVRLWGQGAYEKVKLNVPPLDEQRRIVAYLDSVQARLASLERLQSETQEELGALLPSVLDRAFGGEL